MSDDIEDEEMTEAEKAFAAEVEEVGVADYITRRLVRKAKGEELSEEEQQFMGVAAQMVVIKQFMDIGMDYDTAVAKVVDRDQEINFKLDEEGTLSVTIDYENVGASDEDGD